MGSTLKLESKRWHTGYTYRTGTITCERCRKTIGTEDTYYYRRGKTRWSSDHSRGICEGCYQAMCAAEYALRPEEPTLNDMHRMQKAVDLRMRMEKVYQDDGGAQFKRFYLDTPTLHSLLLNVEYGMYRIVNSIGLPDTLRDYESYRSDVWSVIAKHYKPFLGPKMTIPLLERIYLKHHAEWRKRYSDRQKRKAWEGRAKAKGERVYPSEHALAQFIALKLAPSRCNMDVKYSYTRPNREAAEIGGKVFRNRLWKYGSVDHSGMELIGNITCTFWARDGQYYIEVES